jgi:DNA-binding NarL/FixJ family response regulator
MAIVAMPAKAILVDDHEVVREGLLATLKDDPWLRFVGVAGTGRGAIRLAKRVLPDVAAVDLRLPDMSGEEVCRELTALMPDLKIVVLSTYLSEEAVRNVLEAGASAYVTKAAGVAALRRALHDVRRGVVTQPHEAALLVKELHASVAEGEGGLRITPQQEKVLELVAEGLTSQKVGERLFISESTVRFHIQKLKETTGARSRAELIAKAMRQGLIPPGIEALRGPAH